MNLNYIKRFGCLCLCMLLCIGLIACGDSDKPETSPTGPATSSGTSQSAGVSGTETPNTTHTASGTSNPTAPGTPTQQQKPQLYFSDTGSFKVVIFSDLRVSKKVSSGVIANMEKVLDKEKPSLVLLGGDVHDGSVSNEKELRAVLDALNKPMEERKIPWCNAFGIDTEGTAGKKTGFSREAQMKVYQSYPYCISGTDAADVYGVSNYVLPIRNRKTNKIGFNVWCLDSNGYLNDYVSGLESQVLLKRKIASGTNFDCLHFSQILWYWDTSVSMEQSAKTKIPGMMYFQIPPFQLSLVKRNKTETNAKGTLVGATTKVSSSERESGIVWACYERGDIKGIFCGYNEENDMSGTYLDVLMAFCSTVGKTGYTDTAGARVVTITENGKKMTSSMSYVK